MSNFWVPINHPLLFFIISLSMASMLPNLAKPEKMEKLYSECQKLCESHEFNEVIEKFSEENIPIKNGDKSNAVLNTQGQVNYANLLPAIKQTLVEAKKPSNYFRKDLINILEGIIKPRKSRISLFNHDDTVEDVLNKALKCAVSVHKFAQQKQKQRQVEQQKQQEIPVAKENKGGDEKSAKDWTDLDRNFEAKLKRIYSLHEQKLDTECIELSVSFRFNEMIRILSKDKLPIKMPKVDLDERGSEVVNYSSLLDEIVMMSTMLYVNADINKSSENGDFLHLCDPEQALMKIMEKNSGTIKRTYESDTKPVTVRTVLSDTLSCAKRAHYLSQEMATLKSGQSDKLPKNDWINVDGKFRKKLQNIWTVKVVENDLNGNAEAMYTGAQIDPDYPEW